MARLTEPEATLFVEDCPEQVEVSPRALTIPRAGITIARHRDAEVYVQNAPVLSWGSPEDAAVEADRRLELG